MAATLKRKRQVVSYRELSSDESASDAKEEYVSGNQRTGPQRRSVRNRSTDSEPFRLPVHDAPQGEHEQAAVKHGQTRNMRAESRSTRRWENRNISYRDVSTDDGGSDDDIQSAYESETAPRMVHRKIKQSTQPQKRQRRGRKRPRELGAPLKPRTTSHEAPEPCKIPTDGNKPPWASLPYHVLLQIFVYASHPLHDENMMPTPSIAWLVRLARMCTAFAKPALTALYRNPPIFAVRQSRRDLVRHLISPPESSRQDYRVMVKRLEIDAVQMPSSTDPLSSVTDLVELVTSLTTLKEIDIFDPLDRPPYRGRLRRVRRWNYPEELFSALGRSDIRLQSWRWNSVFCSKGVLWIKEIHADRAFQSLRELTFTKYHTDPPRKSEQDTGKPTVEELLGSALAVLPNLTSLAFETCTTVNGRLLPLLPSTLRSLSITNCIELVSDSLQAFLATHGGRLEELTLNHNQSLSLAFLVDLKASCPRLEVLKMDLNYYSSLVMSADNEPLYDELLGEDEIPTWPRNLRIIDMEYLRGWSSAAATNFFSSLMDSAKDLPWLRELRILAMVDVDWRQRADFRKKWTARFEHVFARRWVPPSPHLMSMRAYREWKSAHATGEGKNAALLGADEESNKDEALESESDAPLLPARKRKQGERWNSSRLRSRAKASAHYQETSGEDLTSQEASDAESEPQFVQGRCHTVTFRIDNSRPREELYDEGDFLDDERSGDEDWNGNDVLDDDG